MQVERASFDRALHRARSAAYPPGEFIGQESFMSASEIRSLALAAGIGSGVSVLDLCCGVAGPGRFITAELGCGYLGVDCSSDAVAVARERAGGLGCRFEVSRIPTMPAGSFDVVILLETMLAFPDKPTLLSRVRTALKPGARFAFTLEEGLPLSAREHERMPDADTVWLSALQDVLADLERIGLEVRVLEERTRSHLAVVDALIDAFGADAADIAEQIGRGALNDLLSAHRLWSSWMGSGRVRKFAVVAELPRMEASSARGAGGTRC